MLATDFNNWIKTEQGQYVIQWERQKVAGMVSDVFGFHAVQIGNTEIDFLAGNRIQHQILVSESGSSDNAGLAATPDALPFASASLDLVVLPHILEFHDNPHQIIREVERCLMPEGQLVVLGFNPFSLWGLKCRMRNDIKRYPWRGRYIGVPRLKDWLSLLGFEIERGHFGRYAPPFEQAKWLHRWRALELAGDRWWPFGGGVYIVRAVKRVQGLRLIRPQWRKSAKPRLTPVPHPTPVNNRNCNTDNV